MMLLLSFVLHTQGWRQRTLQRSRYFKQGPASPSCQSECNVDSLDDRMERSYLFGHEEKKKSITVNCVNSSQVDLTCSLHFKLDVSQ